jgi:uncharacterized protein (DUF4415 family)
MKKVTSKPLTPEQLAELEALAVLPDDAIDTSDAPELPDWSGAKRGLFYRPVKQQLTLRLDADVVAWFKAHAKADEGYQTNINRALREHARLISPRGAIPSRTKRLGTPAQVDHTWLEFSEKLISIGYGIFGHSEVPISEKGASDIRVLAVLLLCRTISSLKGATLLAREKMVVEARIITRCCYENLFFVAALRERGDEFVREIFHDDITNRRLRGEFLLQLKHRITDTDWEPQLRNFLKHMKQPSLKGKRLTPKGIAHGGSVADAYMFYGQLSADAAHPTTDALARYLVRFEENGELARGIDVNPEPKTNELSMTLNWACQAVLGVYVGVNEIIEGKEVNQALTNILEEYQTLNGIAAGVRD